MNGYRLDLAKKTLTITKAFEEAVSKGDTKEYDIYMKFLHEIPGLKVVRRTHKTPSKYKTKNGEEFYCNQFKNLKYENMEGFIKGLPNHKDLLDAFNFLRYNASLVQTARYTVVRKWFVAQFPEFRKNPLFYLNNEVKVIDIAPFIQESQDKAEDKKNTSVAEGDANNISGF